MSPPLSTQQHVEAAKPHVLRYERLSRRLALVGIGLVFLGFLTAAPVVMNTSEGNWLLWSVVFSVLAVASMGAGYYFHKNASMLAAKRVLRESLREVVRRT